MHVELKLAAIDVEYLPAPHKAQSFSSSFPFVDEYFPGVQSKQVELHADPVTVENLPAMHAIQAASSSLPSPNPYLPATHS